MVYDPILIFLTFVYREQEPNITAHYQRKGNLQMQWASIMENIKIEYINQKREVLLLIQPTLSSQFVQEELDEAGKATLCQIVHCDDCNWDMCTVCARVPTTTHTQRLNQGKIGLSQLCQETNSIILIFFSIIIMTNFYVCFLLCKHSLRWRIQSAVLLLLVCCFCFCFCFLQ